MISDPEHKHTRTSCPLISSVHLTAVVFRTRRQPSDTSKCIRKPWPRLSLRNRLNFRTPFWHQNVTVVPWQRLDCKRDLKVRHRTTESKPVWKHSLTFLAVRNVAEWGLTMLLQTWKIFQRR